MGVVEMEDIDEVAHLAPPREGQRLVDGGIGIVKPIAEAAVRLHGVEAVSAVLGPLDLQAPAGPP